MIFTMPMPVLHRAPTEYDLCTEWCETEELKPISNYIGHQYIQMEANILTDWNIDALLPKTVHLIEIDSITSDSVYTHVTLNDEICCAKLDQVRCSNQCDDRVLGRSTSCHYTPSQT